MNHRTPIESARSATAIHPAGAWILLLRWRKRRAAVTSAGPYAAANRIRFSTKWWDDETGLGYWGYRYYSARLGRWMSRDPMGEEGSPHLYGFVGNGPTDAVDPTGLTFIHDLRLPYCAFPAVPAKPTMQPGVNVLDLPVPGTMWNPWLRWIVARQGEHYYISPTSGFGLYVIGLPTAGLLEADADSGIQHALSSRCDCLKPMNRIWQETVMPGSYHRTTWSDGVWSWGNIGGLHIKAHARCNVRSCCWGCKASCTVAYELYDWFHWNIALWSVYTDSVLQDFWWHIPYEKTKFFSLRCKEGT